jgi:hypothetical protein
VTFPQPFNLEEHGSSSVAARGRRILNYGLKDNGIRGLEWHEECTNISPVESMESSGIGFMISDCEIFESVDKE